MTLNPLDTIKFDFLYNKSSDCIKRALHRRGTGDPSLSAGVGRRLFGEKPLENFTEYQLWASIALELLGKAALARHHPCLVVDPRSSESMLAAAGIDSKTGGKSIKMEEIRTLAATEVYKRLKFIVPGYDDDAYDLCVITAGGRNAELHSAASPFSRMDPSWEERYWHTSEIILGHIGRTFNQWFGQKNVNEALKVIQDAKDTRKKKQDKVAVKIERAKQKFKKFSREKRDRIANKIRDVDLPNVLKSFSKNYEKAWEVSCPSCGNRSFMVGKETVSSIMDSTDVVNGRIVRVKSFGKVFAPHEFICSACNLKLSDSDEIRSANMFETYKE